MKKRFAIVLALLMALTLAACGDQNDDPNDVVGGDWRVTGVVRDSGSITRDGGDIDVLVCVNADGADFCYDDETYAIYDYVDYPITLQGDPWEEFRSIDFADRNGDGDSDGAMQFERAGGDGDMTEVDYGTLETDEENLDRYFAVSDRFDDVVYDFNVIDNSVMYWGGEYDYYEKAA